MRQCCHRTREINAARMHHSKHAEQILDVELTDQRDFDRNRMAVELGFEREASGRLRGSRAQISRCETCSCRRAALALYPMTSTPRSARLRYQAPARRRHLY